MAIVPEIKNLKADVNAADILNKVRSVSSESYQANVPKAIYRDNYNLSQIGKVMYDYTPMRNEFMQNLFNVIAITLVTNKLYTNPLARLKKGLLENGETIREIFVDIVKAHNYDPEVASEQWMKIESPNVLSAFHHLNFQKFYKTSIELREINLAFNSWQGVDSLISKMIEALYTSANYDEYQVTKYMIARGILNGVFYPVTIPTLTDDNGKKVTEIMRATVNNMTFMSRKRNMAGVANFTDVRDQIMFIDVNAEANLDVNVLAVAFHLPLTDFLAGERISIDGFGNLDDARLAELFTDDKYTTYTPLTADEVAALNAIPAISVSKEFFMIYDNLLTFAESPLNSDGLYYNYSLHRWQTYSFSPFADGVVYSPVEPTVTAVAVTPGTVTLPKGSTLNFSATVTTTGYASKAVTWSLSGATASFISKDGNLTISSEETATTITITATSIYDKTKSGTATVTVS